MPNGTSPWEVLALFLTGIPGIAGIAVATIGSLGYIMFSSVDNRVPEVSPLARWVQRGPPPDRTQLARYSDEQLEHLTIDISREWAERFR